MLRALYIKDMFFTFSPSNLSNIKDLTDGSVARAIEARACSHSGAHAVSASRLSSPAYHLTASTIQGSCSVFRDEQIELNVFRKFTHFQPHPSYRNRVRWCSAQSPRSSSILQRVTILKRFKSKTTVRCSVIWLEYIRQANWV